MSNPNLIALLKEVMQDDHKYKLTLIEDILKGAKLAYGLGHEDSKMAVTNPEILFDEMYELSINDLQIAEGIVTIMVNKLINDKIKEHGN